MNNTVGGCAEGASADRQVIVLINPEIAIKEPNAIELHIAGAKRIARCVDGKSGISRGRLHGGERLCHVGNASHGDMAVIRYRRLARGASRAIGAKEDRSGSIGAYDDARAGCSKDTTGSYCARGG